MLLCRRNSLLRQGVGVVGGQAVVKRDRLLLNQGIVFEVCEDARQREDALGDRENHPGLGPALLKLAHPKRKEVDDKTLLVDLSCARLACELLQATTLFLCLHPRAFPLFALLEALRAAAALLADGRQLRGMLLSQPLEVGNCRRRHDERIEGVVGIELKQCPKMPLRLGLLIEIESGEARVFVKLNHIGSGKIPSVDAFGGALQHVSVVPVLELSPHASDIDVWHSGGLTSRWICPAEKCHREQATLDRSLHSGSSRPSNSFDSPGDTLTTSAFVLKPGRVIWYSTFCGCVTPLGKEISNGLWSLSVAVLLLPPRLITASRGS